MLVGHVSDEHYQALSEVSVEITDQSGDVVADVRSSASGAIRADVAPGDYTVVLAKDGFGAKRSAVTVGAEPAMFRLLSDRIVGYMWPKWSRSGEDAELRVHSPEAYKAELWRYGLTKEKVALISWFDEHGPRAMRQILPDTDVARDGVAFNSTGFTSPGHVKRITAPEKSGLYYVHITTASGAFYSMPWVVAPSAPSEKIAVLAGTNNWNAYNRFGGRSNYINEVELPKTPTVNARQDLQRYTVGNHVSQTASNELYQPLSFDRPDLECEVRQDEEVTDSLAGRLSGTLAPGFWRLVGWLEREGFGHDVYSDSQLHDGTLDLDSYKVLVLENHPEYWSRQMYLRVKEWVDERGGRVMYLGGNGIDCEIEFTESGSAARYLTQQANPSLEEEKLLETRFHKTFRSSQAELLGVVFTHDGEGTGAPYKVLDSTSWVFEGTGLRDGDLFGLESLSERIPGGASGHETDKVSASTPADTVVLARGQNGGTGGADLVYRDLAAPGGEVFSAGSMTYIPSLLIDEPLSKLTVNVLARFTAS